MLKLKSKYINKKNFLSVKKKKKKGQQRATPITYPKST